MLDFMSDDDGDDDGNLMSIILFETMSGTLQ